MDSKTVIEQFKNQYGYVKNIDAVQDYLKLNNVPLSDINRILLDILIWNNEIHASLARTLTKNKRKEKRNEEKKEEKLSKQGKEKKKTELLDVQNYIDNIELCEDLDFITDILPSPYDNNYDATIYAIIMQIYKNVVFANNFLMEVNSPFEKEYIIEEIKRNKNIIEIIKQYYSDEKGEIEKETEKGSVPPPTFIYLTNELGKPYIYDDIDNISEDDSPFISLLFDSFSTKTKEKKFKSFDELKEISAIRKRDGRIIFSRLDNNVIVVLGVIVKRFQNTTVYRDFLKRRAKVYLDSKEFIQKNRDNEDFLEYNKKITDSLMLKSKELTLRKRKKNGTYNS